MASLLIDIAVCVENIEEITNELASRAKFKSQDQNGVEGIESRKECRILIFVEELCMANHEAQSSVQARS